MNTQMTHEREPWIGTVVDAFDGIDVPGQPDEQDMINQLLAADAEPVAEGTYKIWHYMQHATVRRFAYAAAAVLLIAAVLTGVLLPGGVSPQQTFAQVIENVIRVRNAVMDVVAVDNNKQEYRIKMYLRNPGYMRQEYRTPDLMITIYDFDHRQMLTLMPKYGTASITDLAQFPESDDSFGIVEGFQNMAAEDAKLVEKVTEGGRELLVYDVVQAEAEWRIWTDEATLLPVRMRVRPTPEGPADKAELFFDNMQWDVPLDDSLFAMTPPEDYQLRQGDLGAPGPDDVVRMLRVWTYVSDGAFPDEFHHLSMFKLSGQFQAFNQRISSQTPEQQNAAWTRVARLIGMDLKKLGTPDDDAAFQQRLTEVAGRCAAYLAALAQEPGNWHWTGKGARLGDVDRIVCYWKAPDGDGYYTIDANLKHARVNAEDLPEIPEQ